MEKQRLQSVRNMNPRLYKQLKAFALEKNISVGDALNAAIEGLLKQKSERKKNLMLLLKIKPTDWGKGSENSSTEIDEVLYGGRL
jgi:hypothetical protein